MLGVFLAEHAHEEVPLGAVALDLRARAVADAVHTVAKAQVERRDDLAVGRGVVAVDRRLVHDHRVELLVGVHVGDAVGVKHGLGVRLLGSGGHLQTLGRDAGCGHCAEKPPARHAGLLSIHK